MAVTVTMGGGDGKDDSRFHDFLGMNCGGVGGAGGGDAMGGKVRVGEGEASSGRPVLAASSGSGLVSGRKRSYSDSSFIGLPKERMLPFAPDSSDWTHMMKAYGKDVIDERPRRLHDDETAAVVPPPSKQTSIGLHPPVSRKLDPVYSKWEHSMGINAAHMGHHNLSRFGQGVLVDKGSSTCKDSNVSVVLVPQAAADEGSRTGMKGSGVLKILNSSNVTLEKNTTGMSSSPRPRVIPQITEPEASNVPSHVVASGARQMTIFYAGQAHVFDDVHPNKADVIMALAGSGGGSWSTNYSAKSSPYPQNTEERALLRESQKALAPQSLSQVGGGMFSCQIPNIPQASQLPLAAHVPVSSSGAHHSGGNVVRDAEPATWQNQTWKEKGTSDHVLSCDIHISTIL